MELEQKYGPQSAKIESLFETLLDRDLLYFWSALRYDLLQSFTDLDNEFLQQASRAAYGTAVKAGRFDAWKAAHESVYTQGAGKGWGVDQLHAILALTVSDLVGDGFTQEQLDSLLSIYPKYWEAVGKLLERTEAGSPERTIAKELLSNGATWQEAVATAQRALLH